MWRTTVSGNPGRRLCRRAQELDRGVAGRPRMGTRGGAIARATQFFDEGGFRDRLSELVAIPSTSQDPGHEADVQRYLDAAIRPWLERMGFSVAIHANPRAGFGPILTAERLEDRGAPTILTYGHGDTVRGLEDQWRDGLDPWRLTEEGDRWYGRGSADNKGQHAVNLSALEAVLAERGGKLGFNLKLVLETCEERGSVGLRDFVAAHKDQLAADVLIGSDGPRVMPDVPTIATGTRGTFHFDLVVDLRPGGVHSGHWGGLTTDPAVVLTHALGTIIDRTRQDPGARLAAAERPAGQRALGAGGLRGGRRRRGGIDRSRLGRAWADRGREDLRLEQLHRAVDGFGPAGEPGERGGAECARALPDPLHGGHRSRDVRAGAAPASRRRGFRRRADREPRRAHAGEPHRSGRSLGALDGRTRWSRRWDGTCR